MCLEGYHAEGLGCVEDGDGDGGGDVGAGQDARAVTVWPHGVLVDYIADLEDPAVSADDRDVVHFALLDADAGSVLGRTTHDPAPGLDGMIGECDRWGAAA